MSRRIRRAGLGATAILATMALSACAPAVAWPGASLTPTASSCPSGFVDTLAAVVGDGTDVTFSEVRDGALEPALQGFFAGGCFVGFSGALSPSARIDGVYAFAVTPVVEADLHAALESAGFTEGDFGWEKAGPDGESREILAQTAASLSGEDGLLDLGTAFPAATFLLAAFHTVVDTSSVE